MVICLWSCFHAHPAFACRYNVRETGFVDLGIQPYYLYGYVSSDTPADIVSDFRQISHAALIDSNIEVEIINVHQQKDHPAMKYLDLWPRVSFPTAVLVSPDGQSLLVPVTKPLRPFKQTLWLVLDDILSSPKREEIIPHVSRTYGVVLLIEGADAQKNKRAHEAACSAIERISRQMELMPKPIAHPPVLVVIDSQSFSSEKVLLWSLGLDVNKVSEPYAAVIYGRARRIGPLLKGGEITEAILANILYIVGADCECGLDGRWFQGTMLPVRWDEKIQARVAKDLGFDPENPMVKMEISRIIRHSLFLSGSSEDPCSYPDGPIGYEELVVDFDSDSNDPQMPASQGQNTLTSTFKPSVSASEKTSAYRSFNPALLFYFIAGLIVLIVAAGLFIAFRAVRRNP